MRNNVLEKLKYYKIALFWISAGLLFWILDAFIDAFIFHQDTAFHQLSQPSLQGIYIRSLVFMACTIFGLYYQALINRYRKTQDVLHRKEEKYQDLYNNAPDMFASVEAATGKIIQCNETLAKALGYTKEEIISRHITYVYHPDCEKDRKRVFQSFVQTGEVRNVQLQLKRKHGSKIDVSLSVSAVHDSKGKVLYSRSIWRDISEQKKSEESLRKSEERFDLVSKATNDGIWDRTSFENEEAWWSPRWYELLGYQNGEIKASHRQFASLVHPDDLEGMSKALRDHMEKQLPFDIELRLKTKSGVFKWFQARGQAVWDEKGKPVRIAGSIQDISERKRAEGALRESETLFRTLSSSAPIGIFQTNAEGDCTYANKHWQTISGQTLEESLGNGWSKAIHPDDREVLLKEWAKAVRQGQEFTFEYRIITPQGETRWAHGHVTAISSDSGNLTGYVGTLEDITERKEYEKRLEDAHDKLEQQVKERTIELAKTVKALQNENTERKKGEKKLEEQKLILEQKNIALKEVIAQVACEKKDLEHNMVANFNATMFPPMKKLRKYIQNDGQKHLDIMEGNLKEITSSFGNVMTRKLYHLTPTEIEICNLIRGGLKTKDIATMFNISILTVNTHRNRIRKKLGITNKDINLVSYVQNL